MFSQMLQAGLYDFFFVFIFFIVAIGLSVVMVILNSLIGPNYRGKRRGETYESGVAPIRTAWIQFGASYYLFALIFLAFDVDVLYLFPVLLTYQKGTGYIELVELFIFLFIISLAIVYAWRKGVFEWR
uniref:NADH-quinone oxidoreductase subunit n=2 Tax=Desulfobacterium TaxID=2295 RepID=E1YMK6_9BACT|nr:NAD(P)H-quinone oxidoreductase subunit 3 [uncultured Desulfobacterium sp.]